MRLDERTEPGCTPASFELNTSGGASVQKTCAARAVDHTVTDLWERECRIRCNEELTERVYRPRIRKTRAPKHCEVQRLVAKVDAVAEAANETKTEAAASRPQ